jgi:hypothetical protein
MKIGHMKTSFTIATCIIGSLYGGHSNYAWSGDLDAALEDINIRTDAQNAPKKVEKNSLPCAKASDVNCANSQEELNATAYETTSAIREALVGDRIPNVTINGVSVGPISQQNTATARGF